MGVGIRIKRILRDKNMTIKQLSELSGVSLNTLYSITKRDSERVDEVILQHISAALGTTPNRLLPPENYWEDENGVGHTGSMETDPVNTQTPQIRITAALEQLNEEGLAKAAERMEELAEIPKYQKASQRSTSNQGT